MTLAAPDVLVDPLARFYAQDPTQLPSATPPPPPVAIAASPHERIAWEIAAAVIVAGVMIRHHLSTQRAEIGKTGEQARTAWATFAPTWLRLTVPAVRQAYALGRVQGLTDDELTSLATDYARGIGDYLNESSAAALEEGFNAQITQRWDAGLAWHRAAAAYGLDSRDMKAYLKAAVTDKGVDPIPSVARALVDRAFLARAERIGVEESYSATQAGQAVSWLWLQRQGRLPPGCTREWEMGENEEHCAVCSELAMQDVPLDQPFVLKSGAKIWAPRAHPRCHCRVKLNAPRERLDKAMPTAAGLALVAADTGRVLMIQRANDAKDPAGGTWEFPGGNLERGEAPLVGAAREWSEEVRRRVPPVREWRGIWTCGPYAGFVGVIDSEVLVPTHSRGRVANPDDPDGDAIEAVAWWDLAHLTAGNPALRQELREGIRDVRTAIRDSGIEKADDHWKREPRAHGRWAKVAEAAPTKEDVVKPAIPSSPFREGEQSPFHAGNPFRAGHPFHDQSPFRTPGQAATASPFRSAFHTRRPRPRSLERRVVIIGMPSERPEPTSEPYVLAVDEFHMKAGREAVGAMYGMGGLVDFNRADTPPVASAEISPWEALEQDIVTMKSVPAGMTRAELEENWDALERKARLGFNAAWTEVDDEREPLAQKLNDKDLSSIFRMAGYEDEYDGTEESRQRMIRRITIAVRHAGKGLPTDSLAEAYGDYVTFAEPVRLLGRHTGQPIEDALNDCESAGMEVRSFDHTPVPVEQVFSFEEGFHPHTQRNEREARISSQYSPYTMEYQSALAHFDPGQVPPMHFGMQVLHMMPMIHAPGAVDAWVPLNWHPDRTT